MGKRHRKLAIQQSAAMYDEAFFLQEGEYYPQRHEANVRSLCEKYPQYSSKEIDAIYRQACRIEPGVAQWLGNMELSDGGRLELLDWLKDNFYGFTQKSFLRALERVEGKRV